MKIERLFLVIAIMCVGALYSCDSSTEPVDTNTSLPTQISNDFAKRCPGNTIEKTFTGKDFYGHSDSEETYVYSTDKDKDECLVVYLDGSWDKTIRTIKDAEKLPEPVKSSLLKNIPKTVANGFKEIKEVSQNLIDGKYYILRFVQDIPQAKNCEHTLVMGDDGKVLKLATYQLNNIDYVHPFASDIEWILKHYDGATVLAYVNDLGDDDYVVMHNGILKYMNFDSFRSETNWKETKYELPQGETVPSKVLDNLHASAPGFNYTEVTVKETPYGKNYTFIDGTKPERPGHVIWANFEVPGL